MSNAPTVTVQLQKALTMTDLFWPFLRRLQTCPNQASVRQPILQLLREGVTEPREVMERLERDDFDLFAMLAESEDSEDLVIAEHERLLQQGIACITPASPGYPPSYLECEDPPLTLTVKGSLAALARPSLGVVGSREPMQDSLLWMERELSKFCRERKIPIVSGGARGIDQKAHSVAIRAGVPTIALLPSGLENPYPADFKRWFTPMIDAGGAIVSEYPARMQMWKTHFHHRNRLIAASSMILIVEARVRSGTLITATRAAEIGRPLLVVPGHPLSSNFAGCLELLCEGSTLVRQAEDLSLLWQAETESLSGTQQHLVPENPDNPYI